MVVVLAIAVLVFGTKRLRNLGSDLGGAIKGFKTAIKEGEADMASDVKGQSLNGEVTSKNNDKS